jgi:hypothetical protein
MRSTRIARRHQETPVDLDLFGRILSQSKTLVASWGGELDFVYLPAWARYADETLDTPSRPKAPSSLQPV